MTYNYRLFLCFFLAVLFYACDTTDEKIPSYIYIEPFQFSVRPGEGSDRQAIKDGWIYVGNDYYGAYELPAWVPVLAQDNSEILIIPGYRLNGAITNSSKCALLNPYQVKLVLEPGKTDSISPTTSYQNGLVYSVLEDFDGNHLLTKELDGDVETKLFSSTIDVFEGTHSGLVELTQTHPVFIAEYEFETKIPQSGDPIILELHCKSDVPFSIGFIGYKSSQGPVSLINAGILPNSEWTKLYFDFREIINRANSDTYRLAIQAAFQKDTAKTIQRIFLDNIKVIHR